MGATRFLSSIPNDLCTSLKLFLQRKQAAGNSHIIDDENTAIADYLS